jgi:uncharacterized sulfatase
LAPKEYRPGGQSDRLVNFVDLAATVVSLAGVRPPAWMQGHAFAGEFQAEPPQFLHGSRARMDERPDLVRSVTDGRYVYLRNYYPHVSQAQHVSYQFDTPTTRVWRRLFDEGKATPAQSIFWQVPKSPEELYDLATDPDEVKNLVDSPAHQEILAKLRKAQREHIVRIRDVDFLPEGELHSRAPGVAPYDLAHDNGRYPLEEILQMAETASSLKKDAWGQLLQGVKHKDSAVRWWAVMGFLMRGPMPDILPDPNLVLNDDSPYVRITAAQLFVEYGNDQQKEAALAALRQLAPPDKNGVLTSLAALVAIDALGKKAAPLLDTIRTMPTEGPSPDGRYNSYVPRLVAAIRTQFGDAPGEPPAAKAKGKGKGKAKAK